MKITNNLKDAIEVYLSGDKSAFTTIYNESVKYIYVCVRNVLNGNDNSEDMIEDVVQDTFVEISTHLDSLQNINTYFSWAGMIATRKCYEYIKKSKKYVLLNEDESFDNLSDDDDIIPEEIVQNKEKQRLIIEIINNELNEMQKLCVVAFYYNEMKQSDIAKELGISENTVKSYLFRAKSKIKNGVEDLEKKKGTKLYSVAPLLLLLFTKDVEACEVPATLGQNVLNAVELSAESVAQNGAAGAITGKTAAATSKIIAKKIAVGAVCLIGGAGLAIGGVAAVSSFNGENKVKETEADSESNEGVSVESSEIDTTENNTNNDDNKATDSETTSHEETTEAVTKEPQIIPEGISYYDASEDKMFVAGECFPADVESNDIYYTQEYEYHYNAKRSLMSGSLSYSTVTFVSECWNVEITDDFNGGEILDNILGYPVTDMIFTFYNQKELEVSPKIPDSVKNMPYTYLDCKNLKSMPDIPDNVANMEGTFMFCKNLTELSELPNGLINLDKTFEHCYVITEVPDIPDSVESMNLTFHSCNNLTAVKKLPDSLINMDGTFKACSKLASVPAIPDGVKSMISTFEASGISVTPAIPYGVTDMTSTFDNCKELVIAPDIPDTVVCMKRTFSGCTELTTVNKISANVEDMSSTFSTCLSLTDIPSIPLSVTNMDRTFSHCKALTHAPVIPQNVTDMTSTFYQCKALTGKIEINANPEKYSKCFGWVDFEKQGIVLTGSSSVLAEIEATKNN